MIILWISGCENMKKCEWCDTRGIEPAFMDYPINPIMQGLRRGYGMVTICRWCVIKCLRKKMEVKKNE